MSHQDCEVCEKEIEQEREVLDGMRDAELEREAETLREELNALFVTSVDGRPITRGELEAAFDSVKEPDWKNPICATISMKDRNIVAAAIEFFTATKATFGQRLSVNPDTGEVCDLIGFCSVYAEGYYLGPAN